jgi:hypothetical protein
MMNMGLRSIPVAKVTRSVNVNGLSGCGVLSIFTSNSFLYEAGHRRLLSIFEK